MSSQPKAPVKRVLSREYILKSALYFIDHEGLEALNLRALGRQMGVSQAAMYRYVPNKAALLDGVVELIWQQATALGEMPDELGWREGLELVMTQVYHTLLLHPNAITLIATHPINTAESFQLVQGWLALLTEHGLKVDSSTMFLFNALAGLTLGCAIAQAEPPAGGAGGQTNIDLVKQLADQFPALSTFLSPLTSLDFTLEQSYLEGLHALISGWPEAGTKPTQA
ncbi:hypothetical protein KIM372_07510 [Bombiscardovia nodaiensis]|uniref:HTH tetR-type domain-containing protein n=1 Tax=Bombiscardovia nodaiensis TaxID=2932181 RepID=A0ABN6S9Q4_9BIFI|nr:hypothetical protein KIM372_07510 [Bombiscardovia nodaiensis]